MRARTGQAYFLRIGCLKGLRVQRNQTPCYAEYMNFHNNLFARVQRAVIIHFQMHSWSASFTRYETMTHKSHCLIQNRGTQAAVERPGGVSHPRLGPAGENNIALPAGDKLEIQHVRDGAGTFVADLLDTAANTLAQIG